MSTTFGVSVVVIDNRTDIAEIFGQFFAGKYYPLSWRKSASKGEEIADAGGGDFSGSCGVHAGVIGMKDRLGWDV